MGNGDAVVGEKIEGGLLQAGDTGLVETGKARSGRGGGEFVKGIDASGDTLVDDGGAAAVVLARSGARHDHGLLSGLWMLAHTVSAHCLPT
jgi:hypothetical protein